MVLERPQQQMGLDENPTEQKMSYAIKQGMPVLEGNLLKKNRFFMKQERRFKLYATGHLKYFSGQEEKGCLQLDETSVARKISKYEVELTLNKKHRKTYIFLQVELQKAPPKEANFSCHLDDWVEAINQVVEYINMRKF